MQSSHSLDRIDAAFDGTQLVADAGLLLPATLALHLGLKGLVDRFLDLGRAAGAANVGDKLLTLVMSALAGGDSITTRTPCAPAEPAGSWASASRRPPPWARSCAASAGAMSASSTRPAANSWPGPGRRERDPAPRPSRSISTPRSVRRTASR